jgi:large subunit ribosomal protein L10
MAKTFKQKLLINQETQKLVQESKGIFVSDYTGISTEQLTELRRKLYGQAIVKIAKNRVAKKSCEEVVKKSKIADLFVGPVLLTYVNGDVAVCAKELVSFSKKNDKFVVKGGLLDGQDVVAEDLEKISELPSKDILLGKMLSSLVGPHRGLMYVLGGVTTQLVRTISAIANKKAEQK